MNITIKEVEYWDSNDREGVSAVAQVNPWAGEGPEEVLAELKRWVKLQINEEEQGLTANIDDLKAQWQFWSDNLNHIKNQYNAARDMLQRYHVDLPDWPSFLGPHDDPEQPF